MHYLSQSLFSAVYLAAISRLFDGVGAYRGNNAETLFSEILQSHWRSCTSSEHRDNAVGTTRFAKSKYDKLTIALTSSRCARAMIELHIQLRIASSVIAVFRPFLLTTPMRVHQVRSTSPFSQVSRPRLEARSASIQLS